LKTKTIIGCYLLIAPKKEDKAQSWIGKSHSDNEHDNGPIAAWYH